MLVILLIIELDSEEDPDLGTVACSLRSSLIFTIKPLCGFSKSLLLPFAATGHCHCEHGNLQTCPPSQKVTLEAPLSSPLVEALCKL